VFYRLNRPKKTHVKCDKFKVLSEENGEMADLNDVKREHEEHLCAADEALQQMKTDLQLAITYHTLTLTFHLQKVISLPQIPSNIIYYKRQRSTYNLGMHSGKEKVVHFNVWLENESSRGA